MKKIVFTSDEIRALIDCLDGPSALDDAEYASKLGTIPGTAKHERLVAAYDSAFGKIIRASKPKRQGVGDER